MTTGSAPEEDVSDKEVKTGELIPAENKPRKSPHKKQSGFIRNIFRKGE